MQNVPGLFSGTMGQLGREYDLSPPVSIEVNSDKSYTSTPPLLCQNCVERKNLIFILEEV
jgi:hypothetical protein